MADLRLAGVAYSNVKIINHVVTAFCTVHNICESRREDLEAHLLENVADEREVDMEEEGPIPDHTTGHDTRRALTQYFAQL